MNSQLDNLIRFADFIHRFREVERAVSVRNSDRKENDAEHSYTLALLAWYINDSHKLGLDMAKLMTYAIAHDLVETYAGDTYFYSTNSDDHANKQDKEAQAASKIREEFPEFPELHKCIEQYEHKSDRESNFIYALDKIEPILSIYIDGGKTWRRLNITIEMLETMKAPKVKADPTIEKLFGELIEKLKSESALLFN